MRTIALSTGGEMTWLTRSDWRSPKPVTAGRAISAGEFVGLMIHHTVMPAVPILDSGTTYTERVIDYMLRLQTIRPDLDSEVPYHYVVFPGLTDDDAIMCVGRGSNRTGAHARRHNHTHLGVAIAANTNITPVTPGMVAAIRHLAGIDSFSNLTQPTLGHSDVSATQCPGSHAKAVLDQLQPPFVDQGATTYPVDQGFNGEAPLARGRADGFGLGAKGPLVMDWQRRINDLVELLEASEVRLVVDGDFGPITQQATVNFERYHHSRVERPLVYVDGRVNDADQEAMAWHLSAAAVARVQAQLGYGEGWVRL